MAISFKNFFVHSKIQRTIAKKLLLTIMPIVMVLFVLMLIMILIFNPDQPNRVLSNIIIIISSFITYYLAKKDKIWPAANFIIVLAYISIFAGMYFNGGLYAPAYVTTLIIAVAVSYFYPIKTTILFGGVNLIITGVFLYLTENQIVISSPAPAPITMYMFITLYFIMIIVLSTLPNKMLHETLLLAEEKKEEAEKADRTKDEFLAQMSHEIRTPLNSILNFSSYLETAVEEGDTEDLKDVFQSIQSSGQRMIRTVDLLLNISMLQAGSYEFIPKEIKLDKIIHDLYKEFSITAKSKGLNLNIDVKDKPIIKGDEYTIIQVFANLIDNAIKYTPKGNITLKLYVKDDICTVEVSDTGIGISEEFLPELFNAFTQETTGYSRLFDGCGLGLTLVSEYCKLNKAQIYVESEKNKGTTFFVSFQTV